MWKSVTKDTCWSELSSSVKQVLTHSNNSTTDLHWHYKAELSFLLIQVVKCNCTVFSLRTVIWRNLLQNYPLEVTQRVFSSHQLSDLNTG